MMQDYGQSALIDQHGQSYTLSKTIAAIQTAPPDALPFGPVVQLPRHANLTVVGPGFHDGLVKVRCGNSVYFVFRDDLR